MQGTLALTNCSTTSRKSLPAASAFQNGRLQLDSPDHLLSHAMQAPHAVSIPPPAYLPVCLPACLQLGSPCH